MALANPAYMRICIIHFCENMQSSIPRISACSCVGACHWGAFSAAHIDSISSPTLNFTYVHDLFWCGTQLCMFACRCVPLRSVWRCTQWPQFLTKRTCKYYATVWARSVSNCVRISPHRCSVQCNVILFVLTYNASAMLWCGAGQSQTLCVYRHIAALCKATQCGSACVNTQGVGQVSLKLCAFITTSLLCSMQCDVFCVNLQLLHYGVGQVISLIIYAKHYTALCTAVAAAMSNKAPV